MKLFAIALFACLLLGSASAVLTNYTFYDNWQTTDQGKNIGGVGNIWYRYSPAANGVLTLMTWAGSNENWTIPASTFGWQARFTAVPNNRSIFMKQGLYYPTISYAPTSTQMVSWYFVPHCSVGSSGGGWYLLIHSNTTTTGATYANGNCNAGNYSIQKFTNTISLDDANSFAIINLDAGKGGWVYNLTVEIDAASAPLYYVPTQNSTKAGLMTLFSVNWAQGYSGAALNNFTFSFDNGNGSYVNDSTASMTGVSNWSNVTKVINSTIGSAIRWIVYAWGVDSRMNVTSNSFTSSGFPLGVKAYSNKYNYTEGEPANITAWVNNSFAGADAYINYNFSLPNGTNTIYSDYQTNLPEGINNFSRLIYTQSNPSGVGANQSQNVTINVTLAFGGVNISTANWSQVNLSVYPMAVTNCTFLSTSTMLNVSVFNESNNATLNETILNMYFTLHPPANLAFSRNYTLVQNTTTKYYNTTCIYPVWANYTVDLQIVYSKTGYSTRTYVNTGNYSNQTTNVSLYLNPMGTENEVDFTLKDYAGNLLTNYIIESQRYYSATGSYLTVSSVKTDYAGRAVTYLVASADSYKFIINNPNGTIAQVFSPVILSSSMLIATGVYGITFTLGQPFYSGYSQNGQVTGTCTASNLTNTITCTYADATGQAANFSLVAQQMSGIGWIDACSASASGASGTLFCTNSNLSTSMFKWTLYLTNPDGSYFVATTGMSDYRSTVINWGITGYLIAVIGIIALAAIGSWNPVTLVVMVGFGVILFSLVGIINMGWGAVVGLIIIIGLLVWKSRA